MTTLAGVKFGNLKILGYVVYFDLCNFSFYIYTSFILMLLNLAINPHY